MASGSSNDLLRGRGRAHETLGTTPRGHSLESRRLAGQVREHDHCPGGLLAGHAVQIFSRTANTWIGGKVTSLLAGKFVRVEFELGDQVGGKILHINSEHLLIPPAVEEFGNSGDQEGTSRLEMDPECQFRSQCEPACHAISLGQLLDFLRVHCGGLASMCKAYNRTHPNTQHPLEPNMYAVVELVIKPLTQPDQCSYAEILNPRGRRVDYFVSHSWKHDFKLFVQSIHSHAKITADVGEDILERSYWICSFANAQHDVETLLNVGLEASPFELALRSRSCKGTVMVVDEEATPLSRIWCLYEVFRTCELGRPFHFINKHSVLSLSRRTGHEMRDLYDRIQQIDFCAAEASNEEDRRRIMESIERFQLAPDLQVGQPALRGVAALSWRVKAFLSKEARVEEVQGRREIAAQRAQGWNIQMLPGHPQGLGSGAVFPVLGEASGGHCWKVQVGARKERLRKDKEGIWWQWVQPQE